MLPVVPRPLSKLIRFVEKRVAEWRMLNPQPEADIRGDPTASPECHNALTHSILPVEKRVKLCESALTEDRRHMRSGWQWI